MAEPRKAWATVEYDGKDITDELSESLLSLSYVDKAADEADELSITVHDRDGHWRGDWYPKVATKSGGE